MKVSEELIQHINDRAIPNKDDILHAKEMAAKLVSGIPDAGRREEMRRRLHNAYLNLQLANVADDGQMTARYREECIRLIHVIAVAEPAEDGQVRRNLVESAQLSGSKGLVHGTRENEKLVRRGDAQ